ncbi:MAG: hypothetical protein ABIW76_19815 [Fibrobacteria bacterium]
MRLKGKYLLHRLIWVQVACFCLLLVFINIDDEYLIPRLIHNNMPWSPTTVAGVLDSLWVFFLMAMALYIQSKYVHKIRLLEGILSVCANCKNIRVGKDNWSPIEEYIQERTHADFSHTICPDCGVKLYGDLYLKAVAKSDGHEGPAGGSPG